MGNFNLAEYIEVNKRVELFWEKYPNGRIDTEIINNPNGTVIMKARIYKDISDPTPASTGHAYEKEGSTFVNKTSYIENCETSVVGRALGLMGFEIKKSISSKDEVANAIHQQNSVDDTELKKQLLKKHGGDKAKAKAEYEKIKKAEASEELEPEIEQYLIEKLGKEEVML